MVVVVVVVVVEWSSDVPLVDVVVLPDVSLLAVRSLPALAGAALLVRALVREAR